MNKTRFVLILAIATTAAVSLAIAPSLQGSALAREHIGCTESGSSCNPGKANHSPKHQCKATGDGKCVKGQLD
jgi:hypothetical protein